MCQRAQQRKNGFVRGDKGNTDFLRRLSETTHSTSSSLQFVQGAPCSVTLQRTLRALQHWHAFDALLLTARPCCALPSRPAWDAFLFIVEFFPTSTGWGESGDCSRLSVYDMSDIGAGENVPRGARMGRVVEDGRCEQS